MDYSPGKFEVRICQISCGVGKSDNLVTDRLGERFLPQQSTSVACEPDAPHAWFGSIAGSHVGRGVRDDFFDADGAAIGVKQVIKRQQLLADRVGESHPTFLLAGQGSLQ